MYHVLSAIIMSTSAHYFISRRTQQVPEKLYLKGAVDRRIPEVTSEAKKMRALLRGKKGGGKPLSVVCPQ
jgi:hypothetical protein